MALTTPNLLIVDPLTLLGREVLGLLPRFPELGTDIHLVHTLDDEHQVANLFGESALVPPLDAADQLEECSALLVACNEDNDRVEHVRTFLDQRPDVPVVDLARFDRFPTQPSLLRDDVRQPQVRVPHPSLVVAAEVVRPLRPLAPQSLHVVAVDPVSTHGQAAIGTLARQALIRLNGGEVEELINGNVLAFNLVAPEEALLAEEAGLLFPGLSTTACRIFSGHFHGHLAQLTLTFAEPVNEWELCDAWRSSPMIALTEEPLRLDQIVDVEQVLLGSPHMGREGRQVALTAAVDGLLVGGALTALDLLRRLMSG